MWRIYLVTEGGNLSTLRVDVEYMCQHELELCRGDSPRTAAPPPSPPPPLLLAVVVQGVQELLELLHCEDLLKLHLLGANRF